MTIGLAFARTAKAMGHAFNEAMGAAGGSASTWLIVLSLKTGSPHTQAELADAVGVQGPTMTHHLDGLEWSGLVTREREPANRRVQQVRLTQAGEAMFHRRARGGRGVRPPRKYCARLRRREAGKQRSGQEPRSAHSTECEPLMSPVPASPQLDTPRCSCECSEACVSAANPAQ